MRNNMRDLGEPVGEAEGVRETIESKDEKFYPSVHLTSKQLPELSGVEIGETVMMMVEAKVMGADVREEETSFRLELQGAKVKPMTRAGRNEKMADEEDLPTKKQTGLDRMMMHDEQLDEDFPEEDELK